MNKIILVIFFLLINIGAFAQLKVSGTVKDDQGTLLPGATIKLKENGTTTQSDHQAFFSILVNQNQKEITLAVSFLGYQTKELKISLLQPYNQQKLNIILERGQSELTEVNIVSTGYQEISQERAPGSFVKVNHDLLNRKVSTDILGRLEDIVPGLIFNRDGPSKNNISVRGQSTLVSNTQPLIVIDNFPYEGDINNINPNDVESITVLKDAAAASIWGAKAGNGVIVISTKRGNYNQAIKVSFNANVSVGNKPDLFYQPRMTTADYIDIEKKLFAGGYYLGSETASDKPVLSPVVELLIAKRDNLPGAATADATIEALKTQDVRNDYASYFYRKSNNQQYALNLSGGGQSSRYYVSAGLDKNLDNLRNNQLSRNTVNINHTQGFFTNKLELGAGISFSKINTALNNVGVNLQMAPTVPLYYYALLSDGSGKSLAVNKDYRNSFVLAAPSAHLLNWQYRPLDELTHADNTNASTDYRINASLKYRIIPQLNAQLLYQYGQTLVAGRNLQNSDSYYTRNLVNNYTQVSGTSLLYGIPVGDILDVANGTTTIQSLRAQLNYAQSWKDNRHQINAIAGYEVREQHHVNQGFRYYGWDDEHATSKAVDYVTPYPQYYLTNVKIKVPNNDSGTDLTDRYLSYYANASYTFMQRYILSGSGRLDRSNLFGVKTNQKGVPLWSAGMAWLISKEDFFNHNLINFLKLRATYGYNGNVNKSLSAYTTASYITGTGTTTGLPYASVINPPNPELRWERVKIMNLGVDFESKNGVLSGSAEYYFKKGIDLIGNSVFPPSAGVAIFTGNSANTSGHGFDLNINTRNIDRQVKWNTSFLFSYGKDIVTNYKLLSTNGSVAIGSGGAQNPVIGKPIYKIYSYPWAGLDPANGDPQGLLNGAQSKEWGKILSSATVDNIVYNGPSRPTTYGALRNQLSWNNVSLSVNISYRLGYYFRKSSVDYSTILKGYGGHGDYTLRWQKQGDEAFTSIPSLPATIDQNRDSFYQGSEILVDKGDHLRLQDLNLGYSFKTPTLFNQKFNVIQIYLYANNLAMLYTANKWHMDPDYQTGPPPLTIAFGLKFDL